MRIIFGCEYSGIIRDAFAAKGHDAWSCDLLPTESPGNHIQGDLIDAIHNNHWDMMIATISLAELFGITIDKPFNGIFYFETIC